MCAYYILTWDSQEFVSFCTHYKSVYPIIVLKQWYTTRYYGHLKNYSPTIITLPISEGEWGMNKYSLLHGSSRILTSKGSKEMNSWVLFVSVVVNGLSGSQSRSGFRSVRRCSLTEHITQIKHTQAAISHTEWATRPVGAMTDPSSQPISSDLTRRLSDRPFVESHCHWLKA